MAKLKTLDTVLLDELKDLYNAEKQLAKALPKMEKGAANEELKALVRRHMEETEGQIARLDKIAEILEVKLSGKTCKAMQGLVEELKEALEEESENEALLDALLIGAAQRVEHYEIAGYGTARAVAAALGHEQVAKLLQETLDEEGATDKKLTALSEEQVLPQCLEQETADEEDGPAEKPTRKSSTKKASAKTKKKKG